MNILQNMLRKVYRRYFRPNPLPRLIERGLVIGNNFKMMGEVILDSDHCWHITIGDDVTLAPRVHILSHDASTKTHLNYTMIGKVTIGNRVFIGASAIVLPGVTIGNDVVIGAGSVVSRDIPGNSVAVGNPAKVIGSFENYLERKKNEMESYPCFGEEYTHLKGVTGSMKNEMNMNMKDRYGYII